MPFICKDVDHVAYDDDAAPKNVATVLISAIYSYKNCPHLVSSHSSKQTSQKFPFQIILCHS